MKTGSNPVPGTMKNFIISGELVPDIKKIKLFPHISHQSWPVKDRINGGFYEVKYLHIKWLGLTIQIDNERD